VAHINIDGQDVVPGGLVLQESQEIDLERFIKNGNLNEGNKFKFIERNSAVEQHRGVKLEDGVIRVEYQFEKPYIQQPITSTTHYYWPPHRPYRPDDPMKDFYTANQFDTDVPVRSYMSNSIIGSNSVGAGDLLRSAAQNVVNDAGITVPGSKSEQKFQNAARFPVETEKHVMILKLLGETSENKPVFRPVTVKTKVHCVTCGYTNKFHAQFCNRCGTALKIFA
jgi:hypothetical protein